MHAHRLCLPRTAKAGEPYPTKAVDYRGISTMKQGALVPYRFARKQGSYTNRKLNRRAKRGF